MNKIDYKSYTKIRRYLCEAIACLNAPAGHKIFIKSQREDAVKQLNELIDYLDQKIL